MTGYKAIKMTLLHSLQRHIENGTELFWLHVRKADVRLACSGIDEETYKEIVTDLFKSFLELDMSVGMRKKMEEEQND